MNKRIYLGFVEKSWVYNNQYHSKIYFNVFFNKNEALEYCIKTARDTNHNELYNRIINIIIYEYAYERYYFDYIDGLVTYFNEVINTCSENMYDDLLKCIDCNVSHYNINGELINSEVYISSCKYGTDISFNDYPLYEDDCINGYKGKFKYYMKSKPNKKLISKEIIHGLKILYVYIQHEKINYEDSGYEEYMYIFCSLEDAIEFIKDIIISLSKRYFNGKLLFSDCIVDVYDVSGTTCKKIYTETDIAKILNE